jgi:Zn finger protein HypA/HybF involved in hydrogenase expression
MHELGVTQRILEVALARAAEAHATRITCVHLEIGESSDVSPESVALHWPGVSRGTPAAGASLLFSNADDPFAFRMTSIDVDEGAD